MMAQLRAPQARGQFRAAGDQPAPLLPAAAVPQISRTRLGRGAPPFQAHGAKTLFCGGPSRARHVVRVSAQETDAEDSELEFTAEEWAPEDDLEPWSEEPTKHSGLAFLNDAAEDIEEKKMAENVIAARREFLKLGKVEVDEGGAETSLPAGDPKERRLILGRIVMACQAGGSVEDADAAIEDLRAAGLRVGTKAYHGVISAHVIAGDMDGAVDWLMAALKAGEKPLPETFVTIVRGCIDRDNVPLAEQIVKAMSLAGTPKSVAWMVLVANLFEADRVKEGSMHMEKGIRAKFSPNADLFQRQIDALCRADMMTEAQAVIPNIRGTTGSNPTADQFAPIIEGLVRIDATEAAFRTLVGMFQRSADPIVPDTRCFNALLKGLSLVESRDPEDAARILEVQGMMAQFGNRGDFDTQAYCAKGLINNRAYGIAYTTYKELRKVAKAGGGAGAAAAGGSEGAAAAGGGAAGAEGAAGGEEGYTASKRLHEEGLLVRMLNGLADLKSVDELVECVQGVARDGCELGEVAADPDGRTFVTRWIKESSRYKAENMERNMWLQNRKTGKKSTTAADGGEIMYVPGLKAASKMTVGEIREELVSYGLSSEGLRKEAYDRLQEARKERRIKPEPKARKSTKKKKKAVETNEDGEEIVSKEVTRVSWVAGRRITVVENVNVKEPMSGPAQSTIMSGVSDKEMLQDYKKSVDLDDGKEEEEEVEGLEVGDEEIGGKIKLPDWMESEEEATAKRVADLSVAVELLRAMKEAGGRLTAEDLAMLLEAQGDLPAGPLRAELSSLLRAHVAATAAAGPERRAEQLYNTALKWSLDIPGAGGEELGEMYLSDMERAGVEPDQLMLSRLQEVRSN